MTLSNLRSRLGFSVALGILLMIGAWAYAPGLSGGFLFDDLPNLSRLGDLGGIHTASDAWRFVTSGASGPLGRPISLASFLVNGQNWPTDPAPYLITNLALHLITGSLVFYISVILLRYLLPNCTERKAITAAFFSTAFWVFNPFLVSTTLYIVQRMTILSALFTLLTILLYVKGRLALTNKPRKGYYLMSIGLTLGTLLATLSKENGALAPLLVLIIEITCFRKPQSQQLDWRWKSVFLYFPIIALVSYFAIRWPQIEVGFTARDFSLTQRLMTQARIIWDYLYHLFIPHINTGGLFNDHIQISTSLVSPITTLPGAISCLILIAAALVYKKQWPLFSLAVLFFFTGHLLESSFVPLELYFEHRNYLPSVFLALPMVGIAINQRPAPALIIACGMMLLFIFASFQRASLWGNQSELYLSWATSNPLSVRAQIVAGHHLNKQGRHHDSLILVNQAIKLQPQNTRLHLSRLANRLSSNAFSASEFNQLKAIAVHPEYKFRALDLMKPIVKYARPGTTYDYDRSLELLHAFEKNPNVTPGSRGHYHVNHLLGEIHIKRGDFDQALTHFLQALSSSRLIEPVLQQVALLARAGAYSQANTLLIAGKQMHHSPLSQTKKAKHALYSAEIDRVNKLLDQEMQSNP